MVQLLPEKVSIIGSGIGGLSTAIILAQLGVEVTVLEKNTRPGGLMRSYDRKGLACEVGVHYLGSLDKDQVLRKFFDYLGVSDAIAVDRMGENGVIDRYLFDSAGGQRTSFDLPSGLGAFSESLYRTFPDDKAAISAIMRAIGRASDQLHGLDLLYAADNDFSLLDQAEPFGKILDDLGCPPGLRRVLAIAANWVGVPLDDCPGYYHNMALASYVASSYRLKGCGADMANAFIRRLKALGGTIITNASVEKICVDSRKVTGLRLQSGETLAATTVIGAIHPQVLLKMLPEKAVKPSYRNRIRGLANTHGIFSVHAAVASNVHPAIPYNIFKVDTEESGNVIDLRYFQVRSSRNPEKNVLSILTSGQDELWAPWKNTITGRRGRDYQSVKEELAQSLLKEAGAVLGPLGNAELLDAYTPLTLRDWVNSPGGSAYGVLRSSSQILGTALLNRTAVKGLYLAGQNVMAPGIIGTIMGSFSTVKLMLGPGEFKKRIQL